MNVLIERRSLQGEAHFETPEAPEGRLNAFLRILRETGPVAWTRGPLSPADLEGADVFVLPTKIEPFGPEEIDALDGFVRRGGGLWILSNHDPFDEADAPLAARFGVTLEKTFFHTRGGTTRIEGADLLDHPLLAPGPDGVAVSVLVTNTTCSVAGAAGRAVAVLPETMVDRRTGAPPGGRAYAWAVDGRKEAGWGGRRGRVVAVADSGFLGDRGSRVPGYGLIEEGDNRAFIRRVMRWLGGGGGEDGE